MSSMSVLNRMLMSPVSVLNQHRGRRDVMLHATVMNTRHRRSKTGAATSAPPGFPSRSEQLKRTPFDGTTVLEQGKAVDFGVQTLTTLELSARKRVNNQNGYYEAVATVPLSA